jgi:hypothetical protein
MDSDVIYLMPIFFIVNLYFLVKNELITDNHLNTTQNRCIIHKRYDIITFLEFTKYIYAFLLLSLPLIQ